MVFSSNKSTPIVSRFMFIVAYNNASDWQKRIDLMIRWRSIADKYSKHFNVTVWDSVLRYPKNLGLPLTYPYPYSGVSVRYSNTFQEYE